MSFQNSGDSAFNSKRREGASALSGTSRKQANRRMKTLVNMPRFRRYKLTLLVFARSEHVYSRKYEIDKSRTLRRFSQLGKPMLVNRVHQLLPSVCTISTDTHSRPSLKIVL